jgi:hypothetical protein
MEKVEIRAVIKYLCKKGNSCRLHGSVVKESSSYRTEKNGLLNLIGAGRALEVMSGLGGQKRPPTMILPKLCTIWSFCNRRRDLRSIAREVGISFGSVQAILTDVYDMSKFWLDASPDS